MSLDKQLIREDLSRRVGDWLPVLTTGAGNAGGTTFPSTHFDGYPEKVFRSWYAVSRTLGQYRLVTAFTGVSPATWTVTPAFGAPTQIATAATLEMHAFRPDYFTEAMRAVPALAYPYLHNPTINSSITIPTAGSATISTSSAAGPTTITTPAAHGWSTGYAVTITDHSVSAVNGTWLITVTGATTFTITPTSTGGTGGTATVQTNMFAMPTGITEQMIKQIMQEGDQPFAGRPYHMIDDWSVSPDGTTLWLNRKNTRRYREPVAGKKLYIFAEKYLSQPDEDTAYGVLTTDTTDVVELTEATDYYELYLAYAKCAFFEIMANQPQNQLKQEARAAADRALAQAKDMARTKRMKPMENPFMST